MAIEPSISRPEGGHRASAESTPVLHLHVNGEARQTSSRTLADLIVEAGYGDAKIATAVNGDFVAARQRAAVPLKDGDHVEIVAPRQGG